MSKFTDTIEITIESGKGGAGCVSFRREAFIPRGGPDGGDGGKGGDVFVEASQSYINLSHLYRDRIYKAENGKPGMGSKMFGKDGNDLIIFVPPGTEVINSETEEVLSDLLQENQRIKIVEGGIGGRGNTHFKSSTNQAPRYAQPGMDGERITLRLNLKLIADVGLVGLPNAGKSTFLSKISEAKPKIANYPFTTLIPNLGVVYLDDGRTYKVADMPGIIEGAHKGHGLGLSFLQHIERVKVILYLIELTEEDPVSHYELLRNELKTYNEELLKRPYYIILTKADLVTEEDVKEKISLFDDKNVTAISSLNNFNVKKVLEIISGLL